MELLPCLLRPQQALGGYSGAGGAPEVPAHLEDDLVRLVLAEELEGLASTLQKETR